MSEYICLAFCEYLHQTLSRRILIKVSVSKIINVIRPCCRIRAFTMTFFDYGVKVSGITVRLVFGVDEGVIIAQESLIIARR